MLACADDFHDFQYMEKECAYACALPHEVASVSQNIRDFCNENGEVKRVGNYFIGKEDLGEGMFAKVKKGIHALTGELVAIKVTDKRKDHNDYLVKNLHREAKLLKRLRHPNIVQAYEVIETENKYYLVMELCTKGDLMRYVEQGGALSEKETRKYMRQMVSAIDYLHQASILHRDFKLENILFDSEKNLKLIDFGLSNDFGGETVCGSPAYSSPEVLGAKNYGSPADIWSLGVNMFAMLTATLPYSVDSSAKNIVTLLHAKMLERKINPIPNHLSPECKDLLLRLLEVNPVKRIRMDEILVHPWICHNRVTPLSRCIFPNQLKDGDLNNEVLAHICKFMPECKISMSQLIMSLLNQELSSEAAIYFLLEKRLLRYEVKRSKELIEMNARRKKSLSESDILAAITQMDHPCQHLITDHNRKRTDSLPRKPKSLQQKNLKRIKSERVLPHAYSPDKQRSRHPTMPDSTHNPTKLGLPALSPKSTIEKQEFSSDDKHLPSMQQRPYTNASNRESKKSDLLQWVNKPTTNEASDRLKRHRSFKTSRPVPDPEPPQVFLHPMQRQPSLENLSVSTDGTFTGFDSPSMLSIHSMESDALECSRPHGAGHLTASPPFVPSTPSSETHHLLPHHALYRTQTLPSRPPSTMNRHLPSITPPKVDKQQSRIRKWHSERIKNKRV